MLKLYLSPIMHHAVLSRHALCHLLGLDKFFDCVLVLSKTILNGQNALKNPNKSLNFNKSNFIKQAGFTMLELLVVIALLGVVTIAATTFIIDTGEIQREEATRARWDEIRYAIVGNTSRGLNNAPLVSGYVADMGRLPTSIRQLMFKDFYYDHDNNSSTAEILIYQQPAWASTELSSVQAGLIGTLSGGWRGPYLYSSGSAFFRDGWDNVSEVLADELNSGWEVALSPAGCLPLDCADIAVQSLGDNNRAGGNGFSADFPEDALSAVVSANDWQRPANSVTFRVILNASSDLSSVTDAALKIFYIEDGSIVDEESTTFSHTEVSGVRAATHAVTIPNPLPMGKYAAVIVCSTTEIYDGDCNSANTKPPYYFTLLPSTSSVDIYWNLP
jgi:prepilin-type N-terminal cleavage/methylation domain-containing protein